MTRSTFLHLKKYEEIFKCAVNSNYAKCTQNEYNNIIDSYYGNSVSKLSAMRSFSCSRCKIKELIKIGKDYFDYIQKNID